MSDFSVYRIGRRSDMDIRIDDGTVSRVHAELVVTAKGAYYLTDCGSTGGTYVARDGEWIPVRQEFIEPADAILIGRYQTSAHELVQQPMARGNRAGGGRGAEDRPNDDLPKVRVRRNPGTGEIIGEED